MRCEEFLMSSRDGEGMWTSAFPHGIDVKELQRRGDPIIWWRNRINSCPMSANSFHSCIGSDLMHQQSSWHPDFHFWVIHISTMANPEHQQQPNAALQWAHQGMWTSAFPHGIDVKELQRRGDAINWWRNRINCCLISANSFHSSIDSDFMHQQSPWHPDFHFWVIHRQWQTLNINNSRMLLFNGRSSIPCHSGDRNWPGPLRSKDCPKSITVRWRWRKGSSLSSSRGRVCRLRTSKGLICNLSSRGRVCLPSR